jgi:hypothetical protein
MKRLAIFLRIGLGLGAALVASSTARADDTVPALLPWTDATLDPNQALNPTALVTGAGIKVGEGTIFQPQVGLETGVVSNVFYTNTGTVAAGLLRLLIEIGTGSLPNQRLMSQSGANDPNATSAPTLIAGADERGDFQFSANLYAAWDQYLSTNDNVNAQGGLGGGLLLRGVVNPQQPLQFAFGESFSRQIRATNFESNIDTNRDINSLGLRLTYQPSGRSLGGYLYYTNTIDVFETDNQQFADRLMNRVGLRVNWQWLPLTRVFAEVSEGFDTGIGSSNKVNSYPLSAQTGIQTVLTLNTTLAAHVGYTNGFYASGPSYSSAAGGVMFGYRYSPLGRVTFGYSYDHTDSINANFYRDHTLQLSVEQYFVPFVLYAQPEVRFRQYEGTIVMGTGMMGNVRDDVIIGANAGARYSFRDWLVGTLDYRFSDVQTDFRYDAGGGLITNPSYVRHELLLGMRAAY